MRERKIDLNTATKKDLIENGLLEIFGSHSNGKEMFRFTDKFIDNYPEYFKNIVKTDDDIMRSLWFKGFIDISIDERSEIFFSFTEKSYEWIDTKELTIEEKRMMHDIMLYSRLLDKGE